MIIETDDIAVRRIDPIQALPGDRTALIIVDMMVRFCDPDWLSKGNAARCAWFASELDRVIPRIGRTLKVARSSGALVVHVVNAKWTRDGRDAVPYSRGRDYDLFDTEPMSVIEPLAPRAGEVMIRKVGSSPFTGTGLEFILRNAGIEHVVLCGQYGNACVFYALIQSRELGFDNFWLEDGILYSSEMNAHLFPALVGSSWAALASSDEISGAMFSADRKP